MLEWLFNYPETVWQEASPGFDNPWPVAILFLAIALALMFIAASLWAKPLRLSRKALLFSLQGIATAVLLLMLWQPVLNLDVARQGENTVAWIVDVSKSMQSEDVPTRPGSTSNLQSRLSAAGSVVNNIVLDDSAEFEAALYAQSTPLESITSLEQLEKIEPSATTNLADVLDELLGTVSESALAAVVLLSDGSNNAGSLDAQWWQRMNAAGVPVHTIGIGALRNPGDIQLTDVVVPEQVASGVQYTASLRIGHGSGGSVRVRVLSGRDLIAVEDIDLPDDAEQSAHNISLPSGEEGIRQLRFEVRSTESLMDTDVSNNDQSRIVRVSDAPQRILYVEGEPRWEYKFLRRALNAYPGIEIVSLLRTSPNKFYRQGVRSAQELADGFPASRDDLFSYDAVIIGSLEAAELNTEQQLALRDFVSVRGGSLLMLAGRHGLANGGWGRSIVAAALPVILDARLAADTFERTRVQAVPTVSGYRTPWLSLADSQADNAIAWQGLPELADVQSLGAVKPGAVVLLERNAIDAGGPSTEPLLVAQRYGKGQSLVFGTSGTWRWQMGLDSTDLRHESFWQQLSANLVDAVQPRISVSSDSPVYRDVNTADISLNAFSTDYEPLQQATLPVQMSLPDGSVRNLELQANLQRPGNFRTTVDMPMDGPYTINAMTPLGGESPQNTPAAAQSWWVRESGTAESFNNVQNASLLQRIADATGGSYLAFSEASSIVDVLAQKNAALKREVSLPLWNMPILFIGLILLKGLEWLLRLRWKRL